MKKIVLACVGIVLSMFSLAQKKDYPQDYFRLPLDIDLVLTGTFGELRSNHFHAGIDIKTQEVEVKNVYAVADGFISRIKVSPTGYGKAIYIEHPNGYTSVYAHLKIFNKELEHYIRKQQYTKRSFAVNVYPERNLLKVKKGDIIALSGNTGGSSGPHLHFEIRDTKTQRPINPLLFGINIPDHRKPTIYGLQLLGMSKMNNTFFIKNRKELKIKGKSGRYSLKGNDTIAVPEYFSLGISTIDRLDGANNRNGVYSVSCFLDDSLFYHHNLESFSFAQTRYINALIDYPVYKKKRVKYQKMFIEPGNELDIYKVVSNKGVIHIDDAQTHKLTYKIKDIKGNISRITFYVKKGKSKAASPSELDTRGHFVDYQKRTNLYLGGMKVSIPPKALYNNAYIGIESGDSLFTDYAPRYSVGDETIPVQKHFKLSLQCSVDSLTPVDKLVMAQVDKKGKLSYVGGKYSDGYVHQKLRTFGDYTVTVDTVPPEIKPLNFKNNTIFQFTDTVKLKVVDKLSGVGKYNAYLNDKWILVEYDKKNNLIFYKPDFRSKNGKNVFRLKVIDNKGNEYEKEWTIRVKRS